MEAEGATSACGSPLVVWPGFGGGRVRLGILKLKWTQGAASETKKEAFLEQADTRLIQALDGALPVLGSLRPPDSLYS